MASVIRSRARLAKNEVLAIFKMKNSLSLATEIAAAYGLNEKTVRDIWKGRTWAKETFHLDATRSLQIKKKGRPAGCKDSRPRKTRSTNQQNAQITIKKKTIDDELFEWEQIVSTQFFDCSLQTTMIKWASQPSA